MPRTNSDLVKTVLAPGKDYDTIHNPSLTPFIRVGERMVTALLANCVVYGIDQPDTETLTDLETWIAAWAYKNSDQQNASLSVRSSASYKGQTGKGLESNHYGQTAIAIDPSGLLAVTANATAFVGGAWTGRRRSEQTPYIDRD